MNIFQVFYSRRPLPQPQGMADRAYLQQQTYPLSDVSGNGGLSVRGQLKFARPAFYVANDTVVFDGVAGAGIPAGSIEMQRLLASG